MTANHGTTLSASRASRRASAVLAGAVVAAVVGASFGDPAAARPRPLVNYSGLGAHRPVGDGAVAVAGTGSGDPFDGGFSGVLSPADGTLPVAGDCEPATARLRIDDPRGLYLVLDTDDGAGRVCGTSTDGARRVTHVYTGRYVVTDARRSRYAGTDGWYEIRLADNGAAGVTAVDT